MSLARKIKRSIAHKKNGRTTCPKCHAKLVEKPGYGIVCAECGWWKKPKEGGGAKMEVT